MEQGLANFLGKKYNESLIFVYCLAARFCLAESRMPGNRILLTGGWYRNGRVYSYLGIEDKIWIEVQLSRNRNPYLP